MPSTKDEQRARLHRGLDCMLDRIYAADAGTSEGAKKAAETRKRGGTNAPSPSIPKKRVKDPWASTPAEKREENKSMGRWRGSF